MKQPDATKKRVSVTGLIYAGVLFLFLFIKGLIFYAQLHLGGFQLVFSLVTCGITLVIWFIVFLFSQKAANIVLTVLYAIVSLVMMIDVVYYAYVTKMPSIGLLGMAGQVTNVSDTVLNLIKLKNWLLIIDLPLWFLFAVNKGLLGERIRRRRLGKAYDRLTGATVTKWKAVVAAAVLIVVIALVAVVYPGFRAEYLENELYCYHARDIADVYFSSDEDRQVDKTLYTAPDESGSEYYGLAQGRNLFVIQVEAMQNFVIGAYYKGQEITPNLNRLIGQDTIYFDRYSYQIGGGNTADAEFAVNNSLFAPENNAGYVAYQDNHYHGLPYLLKDNGYGTAVAYHGYIGSFWNRESAYPGQGFDDYISLEDYEETDMFPLGLSDMEMFRQTIPHLVENEEPFYSFIITASSHYPYRIPLKDREIQLKPEDEQTLFGLYLQAINYADRAIGAFLDQLKEVGLYENSMFVIYGDHYALTNTDATIRQQFSDLTGRSYTLFDVFNVPCVIHVPRMGRTETIHTAGGHMDLLPTMLCLLGIRNDKTVMFGQNLLTAEEGFVCEQAHVSIGSFISDEVFFQKPHNNIRSNYAVYSREDDSRLDPDLYEEESEKAAERIRDCAALLAADDILLP